MKKRALTLLLALVMCLSLLSIPYADSPPVTENLTLTKQSDIIDAAEDLFGQSNFGGLYYDEDVLVINIVDSAETSQVSLAANQIDNLSANVRYNVVKYSLYSLEAVKDYLTPFMRTYDIAILDANELTNQVDICLRTYDEDSISAIRELVLAEYDTDAFIHFAPYRSGSIESTVGTVDDPGYFNARNSDTDSAARSVHYPAGSQIIINDGLYTLGPTLSNSRTYTAGHGYTCSATVYLRGFGTPNLSIGSVTSHYGGSTGDWGSTTVSGSPAVSKATPVLGNRIYMWGGISGVTSGSITRTNITIAEGVSAPFAPLTGMCEGSYSCAKGDSGAGLFSVSPENISTGTVTYGIQSMALFDSNGTWAGASYFTPITKVY